MKGSIRIIGGLVLTLGGVGTVENSMTNPELFVGIIVSLIGLAVLASGAKAVNPNAFKGL